MTSDSGATLSPGSGYALSGQHHVERGPPGNGMDLRRSTRAQQTWDLVSGRLALPDQDGSALE